jgi:hypothetical protein
MREIDCRREQRQRADVGGAYGLHYGEVCYGSVQATRRIDEGDGAVGSSEVNADEIVAHEKSELSIYGQARGGSPPQPRRGGCAK